MNEPTCGDCVYCSWLYPSYCNKHRVTEGRNALVNKCPDFREKNMTNIKITAEVNGKQVPLETISTETFEAIKALEKPKEIPVARIGHYKGNPSDKRLLLKITDSIRYNVKDKNIDVIAINLQRGTINNVWAKDDEVDNLKFYENVRPL